MAESVYFTSLQIKNLRCFGDGPEGDGQPLNLTSDGKRLAQWTLILGENGAGKTTLLQSVAWTRPYIHKRPEYIEPQDFRQEHDLFGAANEFLELLRPVHPFGELELNATLLIGSGRFPFGNKRKRTSSKTRSIRTALSISFEADGKLRNHTSETNPDTEPDCFEEAFVIYYGANRQSGKGNLEERHLEDAADLTRYELTELYDVEQITHLERDQSGNRNAITRFSIG